MICSNERGLIPWILNDRSHSAKPWKIMVGSLVNLGRVIVEEGGEGRWIRILYTWQRKRERIVGVEYPCVCVHRSILTKLHYDPQPPFFNHALGIRTREECRHEDGRTVVNYLREIRFVMDDDSLDLLILWSMDTYQLLGIYVTLEDFLIVFHVTLKFPLFEFYNVI